MPSFKDFPGCDPPIQLINTAVHTAEEIQIPKEREREMIDK